MANLIGQSLGRYDILNQLGEGGMATVYKAYDTRLDTNVAVKVIRTEKLTERVRQHALKRFEQEAKALAILNHPNIVKVIDFGEYTGQPYLVMPYLSGGTLKDRLGKKTVPWQTAFRTLTPIVRALEYAHQREIIHRDVKSSNILLTDSGQLMLSDFGVAKILLPDEKVDLTGTGMSSIGTPDYMAPEQWTGNTTFASDQYSLGVVLYEMLTAKKPYFAETPAELLVKQATEPLTRPSSFVSLPNAVEDVLLKMLARNPNDRYSSMEEVGQVFDRYQKDGKITFEEVNSSQLISTNDITMDLMTNSDLVGSVPHKHATNQRIPARLTFLLLFVTGIFGLLFVYYGIRTNKYSLITSESGSSQIIATSLSTETLVSSTASPTSTSEPTVTQPPPTVPALEIGSRMVSEKDDMGLAYVPGGKFTMGSNDNVDEQPIHQIDVGSFWIDETEVTNKMYARCVDLGGCDLPKSLDSIYYDYYYGNSAFDDYPVVNINWNMAKAYCAWTGRDLPTEAQWEKAARGPDGRTYPWGEGLHCDFVDFFNGVRFCSSGISEIKSHPNGASIYGVYDLSGNVREWVNSAYKPYPYDPGDGREDMDSSGSRGIRGGSGYYFGTDLRSANRGGDAQTSFSADLGFRCAVTINK